MTSRSALFVDDATSLPFGHAVAAILILPDGRYLLQHRDDLPGIWYPDHWGCFGGGIDRGEDAEPALYRELWEELRLRPENHTFFLDLRFDLAGGPVPDCLRRYYEVRLGDAHLADLRLGEGQNFGGFTAEEVLGDLRIAPYDAFALFLHARNARLRTMPA